MHAVGGYRRDQHQWKEEPADRGGGRIRLEGKAITLEGGTGGVRLCHGRVERRKGKEVIVPSAHLYVFSYQGKETLVSLSRDTHLLGCRYEDYSGDSYRFKDDPQEENYDWGTLGIRVLGGLVIVGTVVIGQEYLRQGQPGSIPQW